jgi:hypothetical protein
MDNARGLTLSWLDMKSFIGTKNKNIEVCLYEPKSNISCKKENRNCDTLELQNWVFHYKLPDLVIYNLFSNLKMSRNYCLFSSF